MYQKHINNEKASEPTGVIKKLNMGYKSYLKLLIMVLIRCCMKISFRATGSWVLREIVTSLQTEQVNGKESVTAKVAAAKYATEVEVAKFKCGADTMKFVDKLYYTRRCWGLTMVYLMQWVLGLLGLGLEEISRPEWGLDCWERFASKTASGKITKNWLSGDILRPQSAEYRVIKTMCHW